MPHWAAVRLDTTRAVRRRDDTGSADEFIETNLPAGSNQAWLVTKHFEVYEKLKSLLDNPNSIEPLARRGEQWARDYSAFSSAGPRLRATLNAVLDGTYSRESPKR